MTATTAITPFNFNNNDVRVIIQEGNPWFVAADVCAVLGVKNHRDSLMHLDDDEKGVVLNDTLGGKQQVSVVNESGLYALVLRSRKPEAKKFTKWVTSEVLPAIRKTGKYERPTNPAIDYDRISPAQAQDLKELVHAVVDSKVQGFGETWARLHKRFRVNSYLELPATRFEEARDYLLGKLPEQAQPSQPDTSRMQAAFDAAAQAAAAVQKTVFNSVLAGNDEWKFGRWMLAFIDDSAKGAPAYVRQLEHGSFTTTWPRLVRDVGTGECMCTTAELLDMAAACMQRLQQRGAPARIAA